MSRQVNTLAGQDTLIGSWQALAQTSRGARVITEGAVTAAVFPSWAPLNNAMVVDASAEPAVATQHLVGLFAEAGIEQWALWLPSDSTDLAAPDEGRRVAGMKRDTTTLVMELMLPPGLRRHRGVVRTSVACATRAGDEPVPVRDLDEPEGIVGLSGWVMVSDGLAVSSAWTYLDGIDCGIYAVGTLPSYRRRGLARSLTEHVLADAQEQGARTATLQSTRMGQPLYESLGFQAVGRYEEWLSS